jgi:hypothetical protein
MATGDPDHDQPKARKDQKLLLLAECDTGATNLPVHVGVPREAYALWHLLIEFKLEKWRLQV